MKAALCLFALAACGDVADQWQLDHERIIAVRATPPHIMSGSSSTIDVFVGHMGAGVEVVAPDSVVVQSPTSLINAVSGATVTAPGETTLAQVRSDLGLAGDAPVPLEVEIEADGFAALKTVYLGDSADNPTFDGLGLLVNNVPPPTDPTATITVDTDTDIPLFVNVDDTVDNVNWLTSAGTMTDFDLHAATLHVNPSDPQSGQLAIVLRDNNAGVVWEYWSIQAE